jgi:hypothetical protein
VEPVAPADAEAGFAGMACATGTDGKKSEAFAAPGSLRARLARESEGIVTAAPHFLQVSCLPASPIAAL